MKSLKSVDEKSLYEKLHEASERAALIEAHIKALSQDITECFCLASRINYCNMKGYENDSGEED